MNKFTKLILTTAVFATGVMASESYVSGNFVVNGTVNQNQSGDVNGLITVSDGGTFNNKATLSFKTGGGLNVSNGIPLELRAYQAANQDYKLNIVDAGMWRPNEGHLDMGIARRVSGQVLNEKAKECIEKAGLNPDEWNITWYPNANNNYVTSYPIAPVSSEGVQKLKDNWPKDVVIEVDGAEYPVNIFKLEPAVQSEKDFITAVKTAIENYGGEIDAKEKEDLLTGVRDRAVFENAGGVLDFLEADSNGTFSGKVSNGRVRLKDTTVADLTGLKVIDVNLTYDYDNAEKYSEPTVSNGYITVSNSGGKTEGEAKAESLGKFTDGSNFASFSGTPYGEVKDLRLTFPGILADGDLNKKEYKLKIDHIPTAVKDYTVGNGLDVNDTINIQFEGSDALQFATGKTDGTDKVIEFAGDQSAFTGSATFASEITKVVANGEKTLPVNLASDMSNITLEINGGNTIKTSGETTVKNLKLNSKATLTVAAGTTLNIGENALS